VAQGENDAASGIGGRALFGPGQGDAQGRSELGPAKENGNRVSIKFVNKIRLSN
jgi:hypothetical protein